MNFTDIILILVIVLIVFLAARHIFKKRKSGCSCGCSDCANSSNCPKSK